MSSLPTSALELERQLSELRSQVKAARLPDLVDLVNEHDDAIDDLRDAAAARDLVLERIEKGQKEQLELLRKLVARGS